MLPGTVVYPTTAPGFTYPPLAGKRVRHRLIAWPNEDRDYVEFQVVVEIQNVGTEPVELVPLDSAYTILAPDGSVTASGDFTAAFPIWLAAGESGYMVAWDLVEGLDIEDFEQAEVSAGLREGGREPPPLVVSSLRARTAADELRVTGLVQNDGSVDLEDVWAGVILLDADAQILGVALDISVDNLAAGERKGFTADGAPPIDLDDIAELIGVAASWSFGQP